MAEATQTQYSDIPSQRLSDSRQELTVHVAPKIVAALESLCSRHRITPDEGVRRAIALWNYLENEQASGHRLAIIARDSRREEIREIELT